MRYLKSTLLFFFLFSCSVAIADEFSEMQAKAKSGNVVAQYNLGVMYERGLGVAQDYKLAVHW